jgi:hypothetical protein
VAGSPRARGVSPSRAHQGTQRGPLTPDELTAVLTRRLPDGAEAKDGGIAHATAIATNVRITGGFRLVDRLVTQIERIQALNTLTELTPEVVDAAHESLLVGH